MLIICNGMVRSGSTLQYNIVKLLIEATNNGKAEGFFKAEDIGLIKDSLRAWENEKNFHLVKMHDKYPFMGDEINPKSRRKILYIYRDIRDVAASLKIKLRIGGKPLASMLDKAVSVSNEIMSCRNVLSQKYEDVHADLSNAVVEISEYLDIPLDAPLTELIMDRCSIKAVSDSVRNHNKSSLKIRLNVILNKVGSRKLIYDEDTLFHHNHISAYKGSTGIWTSVLDSREQEMCNERYSDWLDKMGYL